MIWSRVTFGHGLLENLDKRPALHQQKRKQQMFVNEQTTQAEIIAKYKTDFEFAAELITIGSALAAELCASNQKELSHQAKSTVIALLALALRRLRSILAVAELGFTENCAILTRTLFEILLAARFILHTRRVLAAKLPAIPRGHKAVDFRALLYSVRVVLDNRKVGRTAATTTGLKRVLASHHLKSSEQSASECEALIGPEWTLVLNQHPFTYSGLTIAQLSKSLGLARLHAATYGPLSTKVHACDANSLIMDANDGQTLINISGGDINQLSETLQLATSLLFEIVRVYRKYFRLNPSSFDDFARRFDACCKKEILA